MSFYIVIGLALSFALWLLSTPLRTTLRRRRIGNRPFPAAWREILRQRVPYFRALPADLQLQLKRHIQIFIHEKPFIGCLGLEITDEMRVTIAAQACLLLLNRKTDYFPTLRQILIYPGAFVVERLNTDSTGLAYSERQALAGESWSQGQVILSWDDTLENAATINNGRNVVIHEFAHQLDQEKGQATGAPYLAQRSDYARWSKILSAEFAQLQAQAAYGQPSLFNPYGATNPGEFFAVITETFFEQAEEMFAQHPALFLELSRFYRVNPLSWN